MLKIAMIAAGGSIGAVLRYGLGTWIQRATGPGFPYGTFSVNTAGCLLIGFLAAYFDSPQAVSEELRQALMVGLLGSFTTFSTFSLDNYKLLIDGQHLAAAANVIGSVVLGLVAVWLGYRIGLRIYGV